MPIPIVIAIALLIEAAITALIFIARRVIVAVAVDLAWEYVRPRLLDWVDKYVPEIVVATIKYGTGLNVELPITPDSLTNAINEKVGEPIFTDITDPDTVKLDAAKFALSKLNQTLPGLTLTVKDFTGTPAARARLRYKMRIFIQTQTRMAMEQGSSQVLTTNMTTQLFGALQEGYDWVPRENKTDIKNVVGRYMARWWTRHLTRTWTAR